MTQSPTDPDATRATVRDSIRQKLAALPPEVDHLGNSPADYDQRAAAVERITTGRGHLPNA